MQRKEVISSHAPFYSVLPPFSVKNTVNIIPKPVFGVRSAVYSNKDALLCDELAKRYYLGHIFFFDVDEPFKEIYYAPINEWMRIFEIATCAVFITRNGFHIISFDIRTTKIAWFEPYLWLRRRFHSDYEFNSDWILRLSKKGDSKPPLYKTMLIHNCDTKHDISIGHLMLYEKYCDFPAQLLIESLYDDSVPLMSFCQTLTYPTWNY